jgi:hypothetical protein
MAAAAAPVAFSLERWDLSQHHARLSPAILKCVAPSTSIIVALNPAVTKLIPVPWQELTLDDGTKILAVGEGQIQAALYDLLALSTDFLAEHAKCAWFSLRIAPSALSRLISTAVARGFQGGHKMISTFQEDMRKALVTKATWPEVKPEELEVSPATDFAVDGFQHFSYLQWSEAIEVHQLANGAHTSGWGVLLFTMEPCWIAEDRWKPTSALVSTCSQWHARCQSEYFPGAPVLPRPAMFALSAITLFQTAMGWSEVLVLRSESVNREAEFVRLLGLPSKDEKQQAINFGMKVADIVRLLSGASSLRLLMGRTDDLHLLYSWYRSLVCKFLGKAVSFDLATVRMLSRVLEPRLGFLELPEGTSMSDEQRVRHVLEAKSDADNLSSTAGASGEGDGGGGLRNSSAKLDALHLSTRFGLAVAEIRRVLSSPDVTSQAVLEVTLKQAIPWLSQHILGKRDLDGHAIYRELSPHRCIWGPQGDAKARLGLLLGQKVLKAHLALTVHDTAVKAKTAAFLADFDLQDHVVNLILNGRLEDIEFENDVLSRVTAAVNGRNGFRMPAVAKQKRYLIFSLVDRLCDEVGPLFECLGLGGVTDGESFSSIMQEVKYVLRSIEGTTKQDEHDLLYGEEFGLQPFVFAALKCGSLTLKQLFLSSDPTVEVIKGKLLQKGPMAFKHKLVGLSEAIGVAQHESRVYSSRAAQTRELESRISALETKLLAERKNTSSRKKASAAADDDSGIHLALLLTLTDLGSDLLSFLSGE